tara:strand:- start:188 stop:367 length:180 start_codon:yes stop_codon:yes gene_type:complete
MHAIALYPQERFFGDMFHSKAVVNIFSASGLWETQFKTDFNSPGAQLRRYSPWNFIILS